MNPLEGNKVCSVQTSVWIGATVVVLVTLVYAVLRAEDQAFLDAVMSGLISTIVGVALGVPVGLELARRQMHAEASQRQREEQQVQREYLKQVLGNVSLELNSNQARLEKLSTVLHGSAKARSDAWNAAVAVADSFVYGAYQQLRTLPGVYKELESHIIIISVFCSLRTIAADVHAARALHSFYMGYSADDRAANEQLDSLRETVDFKELRNDPGNDLHSRTGSGLTKTMVVMTST